jgi:hypothetical protein
MKLNKKDRPSAFNVDVPEINQRNEHGYPIWTKLELTKMKFQIEKSKLEKK